GAPAHTSAAHARSARDRVAAPAANHAASPEPRIPPSSTRGSTPPSVSAASGASASRRGSVGPGAPSPPGTHPVTIEDHHAENGTEGASAPPASRAPPATAVTSAEVPHQLTPPSTSVRAPSATRRRVVIVASSRSSSSEGA